MRPDPTLLEVVLTTIGTHQALVWWVMVMAMLGLVIAILWPGPIVDPDLEFKKQQPTRRKSK